MVVVQRNKQLLMTIYCKFLCSSHNFYHFSKIIILHKFQYTRLTGKDTWHVQLTRVAPRLGSWQTPSKDGARYKVFSRKPVLKSFLILKTCGVKRA